MTRKEFVNSVTGNVKSNKWLTGWYPVNGTVVGVKSFGLWVQALQLPNNGPSYDSGFGIKTQKVLKVWINETLTSLGVPQDEGAV